MQWSLHACSALQVQQHLSASIARLACERLRPGTTAACRRHVADEQSQSGRAILQEVLTPAR